MSTVFNGYRSRIMQALHNAAYLLGYCVKYLDNMSEITAAFFCKNIDLSVRNCVLPDTMNSDMCAGRKKNNVQIYFNIKSTKKRVKYAF